MLSELYQYAIDHQLASRPGFKPKRPKAYVLISRSGSFLGMDLVDKALPSVMAPDIGSAANGTKLCNPLIEKACIPLCIITDAEKDKNVPTKHAFFRKVLTDGTETEPAFGIAEAALSDEVFRTAAAAALTAAKLKPSDPIGFKVDGMPLEAGNRYPDWWVDYRNTISEKSASAQNSELPLCLITGQNAPALETVPKVSGLFAVGGHTSGDAFLCFDKDAFQSYGLKQSLNAPVSEEAMTAVNATLTKLIADAGRPIGGAKLVHWYSCEIEEDPMEDFYDGGLFGGDDEEEDDPEENEKMQLSKQAEQEENEHTALLRSAVLSESIHKGERPELGNARYYILPLSGAGGRMMVRGWQEGNFADLCGCINAWFDDVRLVSPGGKGRMRNPKLMPMLTVLRKPSGIDKKKEDKDTINKKYDSVNSELSSLTMRILNAVLTDPKSRLPDEVPIRALHYLRSAMLSGDQEGNGNVPAYVRVRAYQWLKIWLLREQRAKGTQVLMEENLNPKYPGIAYQCGRMMAVFAEIQQEALGDVNAGVVQRYFASASRAPKLVIGKLTGLCNHHLSKIENPNHAKHFERLLREIAAEIGTEPIPSMLSVEQQTEFALGYYQQQANMYEKYRTDDPAESEKN